MQRREFIAAVATAGVAAAAGPRATAHVPAARVPAAAVGIAPPDRPEGYAALEAAAGLCLDTAEDCLRECFGMLASRDASMAACADAATALIAACRAVRTLAAANSVRVPIFAKAVEQACIGCRLECDRFPGIAACVACGDACASCAAECRWVA
jgi:Cys-rich four helix bundle protein (predicted Tat secretion target)